jgi:small subunit ribosomal protein S13
MARLAGVDIPNEKRIEIALTYVYGIGRTLSGKILTQANVDPDKRTKELSDTELAALQTALISMNVPTEGELRRMVTTNIRRLQENGSYRGHRHKIGLPVRGQRTRSNARTRKGKKKTVGGQKKKLAKK